MENRGRSAAERCYNVKSRDAIVDTPYSPERRALKWQARWKKTPRSADVRIDLSVCRSNGAAAIDRGNVNRNEHRGGNARGIRGIAKVGWLLRPMGPYGTVVVTGLG